MTSLSGEAAGKADLEDNDVPLVVDVDGTLVATDLLLEGLLRLLASSPSRFIRIALQGFRGRAAWKRAVTQIVPLPPTSLVLNPSVVDEIELAKRSGRPVWLASGADGLAVEPLAKHVDADGFLASDGRQNLVGDAKAESLVKRFGTGGFDYVGNSRQDLPVWRHARRAVAVGASTGLKRRIGNLDIEARFCSGMGSPRDYLRSLRPHQWVKNALVFVPAAAAHVVVVEPYLAAAGAFVLLSLIASSGYIVNDMLDIGHDRGHPSKRYRPLAAGKVRFLPLLAIGAVLGAAGVGTSFLMSPAVGTCAVLYLVLAVGYSLWLKRAIFVDVIVLASLYVLRVVAGGVVADVAVSPWLLAFSLFVFVCLAIVKRRKELADVAARRQQAVLGRGYVAGDAGVMTTFGAASAIGAVIVLALYAQSPDVAMNYARPELLMLACPLFLYWLGRLLLLANRGAVDDDPVMFAIRDKVSWVTGLFLVAVFAVAL